MEKFSCKTRILAGNGCLEELGKLGAKRLFLVTDPFFGKNGTAQRLAALTGAEKVMIFDKVVPDPSVALAAEGAARFRDFQPDLLVALGGGSAMDCAKAIGYFGGGDFCLAAVPTTSGSGSEVTDFAILTHDGVKHPLVDEKLQPDLAILDGDLLGELPKGVIADSGFDVLSHALEACAATGSGSISDSLARDAARMVFEALPGSFAGDLSQRLNMHKAACMAGLSFTQAGLGLCHAMAHALGGAFHVPHGRLNGILLPAVIRVNAESAGKKYAELARAAGIGSGSDVMAVRELRNRIIKLRRQLELPATLAEAGVNMGELREKEQKILDAVLADPCCGTNPVKVEAHLIRRILSEVAGRG